MTTAHWQLPQDCRFPPAAEEELDAFEAEFGKIPEEFRWYLKECGGGVVGSEWVNGITQLRTTHIKFQSEADSWSLEGIFVIGWDGWGNPFGIERTSGRILAADHDFGGAHQKASTFLELLRAGLLGEDN